MMTKKRIDPEFIEVQAKSEDEPRFLVIGRIANKYGAAS